MKVAKVFSTVDLFSGCGGMSLGFEKAGFDINAAFEQEAGLMMQELLDNGLITPR